MSDLGGGGLVLVGLPGSGKSTIGGRLAERLGRPFIDLDESCRRATGRHPGQVILEEGEARFREIESALVGEACATPGAVIATGGGSVVDPLSRWRLWEHGVVAWLDAPFDTLLTRLDAAAVTEPRPLLSGDGAEKLAAFAAERAPFYRAADLRLDAGRPADRIADDLLRVLDAPVGDRGRVLFDAQPERHHPQGPARARIVYGHDLGREQLADALSDVSAARATLVADPNAAGAMAPLIAALPASRRHDVAAGEPAKRLATLEAILEWLSDEGAERGDPLIALGGGTLGDLAGFAAAVYLRGVPLVQMPTTWLAQADSAIGGKVGVDLSHAKNAVGATWPAWAVIADVAAVRRLPEARLRDGFVECIKAGLIGDPALWRLAEVNGRDALHDEATRYALLERAVRVKLAVVDRDPYEAGERRTLNLGHTLGHGLEVESGYRLSHGAAVALGLRAVASIAADRGAEPDLADRIDHVLDAVGFPLRRAFDAGAVRRALLTDKKRMAGRQRWILPMAVGRVEEVDDVTDRELDRAMGAIATDERAA